MDLSGTDSIVMKRRRTGANASGSNSQGVGGLSASDWYADDDDLFYGGNGLEDESRGYQTAAQLGVAEEDEEGYVL
jgi:hypothetical protein